jgi:DUF1365 family protein
VSPLLQSCLYLGTVRHRRLAPERDFRHRLALAYIDLEELPELLGGRLLLRYPGLVRFRRSDYLGDPRVRLDRAVRDAVEAQTGVRPLGPVRVLTHLRSFGHCFNPVSFYYCFEADGERLQAVVAEVTNTPWGERHAYVISGGVGSFEKLLHVSPFMPMDHVYSARAMAPGRHLSASIENHSRVGGEKLFEASLALERRELTPASLRRVTLRYPLATVRVLGLIYAHALLLRLAGVRPFPHPRGGTV